MHVLPPFQLVKMLVGTPFREPQQPHPTVGPGSMPGIWILPQGPGPYIPSRSGATTNEADLCPVTEPTFSGGKSGSVEVEGMAGPWHTRVSPHSEHSVGRSQWSLHSGDQGCSFMSLSFFLLPQSGSPDQSPVFFLVLNAYSRFPFFSIAFESSF